MGISIVNYSFDGPFDSTDSLEDRSGVYVILCLKDGKYYVIDVGEAGEVKKRVENHDREDCWERECDGIIKYAVLYTPNKKQKGRKEIEQEIRDEFDPPCGKR